MTRFTPGPRAFELLTAVLLAVTLGSWWAGRPARASTPRPEGPSAMDTTSPGPAPLTDQTFAQLRSRAGVTLIDLWAPWCPPCRAMAPVIDGLARSYAERAVVAKLDVDDHPEAAESLGVRSIPTFVVFKDGEEVERLVGAQSATALEAALDRALSP